MADILFPVSVLCLVILLMIFLLKRLRQPYLVAYILAGLLLGPGVTGAFSDPSGITTLGDLGILLLMFFLGMEIEIPDHRSLLIQPIVAQGAKMLLSFFLALVAGYFLHWKPGNILILTILLVFNSTAVVSEFLRMNGEWQTLPGRLVLNMLLLQDVLVAPAFTAFQLAGGRHIHWETLSASVLVCGLLFLLLRAIRNRTLVQWKGWQGLEEDHELQVFFGAFVCLGFALLASKIGLSAPIGSFAAGIYLGRTTAFRWLGHVLEPFKVFFVALFFVSVGLMLDPLYIWTHKGAILSITLGLLLINSLLSASVFRLLGYTWMRSLQMGALLSQTGELGVLACTIAWRTGIIDAGFYKLCVAVTGLALLLSTAWMTILRRLATLQLTGKFDSAKQGARRSAAGPDK